MIKKECINLFFPKRKNIIFVLKQLIANVFLFPISTHIANDVATPHELTFAFLFDFSHSRLVTSSAAQQTASVYTLARSITNPTSRTQNA